MSEYELSVVGGTVVTSRGRAPLNVHVSGGRIVAIDAMRPDADQTVDATGLLVLPGFVDTHVHLMDPGDSEREDFPTGTAAAAARGVTTIVEHTHAHPVRTADELAAKLAHLDGRAHVDYGLAAHVWPDHLNDLQALWAAGISYFKIFTCTTHGVPGLGPAALKRALDVLAVIGAGCLVHCEDESLTAEAERSLRETGREDGAVIAEWRSAEAELVAAQTAVILAASAGARTTIAHVSSPAVVRLVNEARHRGADVAAEACPQYFVLREDELLTEGALRKFTPPARIRAQAEEDEMWELLRTGGFHHVASDHAPSTRAHKLQGSIWEAHFGLPGLDTTAPILLDAALTGRMSLERLAYAYAEGPARRYGLYPRKGALVPGADADLVLVDTVGSGVLTDSAVISKAGWTPYAGRRVRGRHVATFLRGELIATEGDVVGPRTGRFLPGRGATTIYLYASGNRMAWGTRPA
jgi:allantoinase